MFEILFKYPQQDYARGELIFTADWSSTFIGVIAIVSVVAIIAFLFWRRRHASILQLATVGLLQIAMLATVLVMLMQPALRTEQLKAADNTIALVVDTSESMVYGDGRTRLAVALESLSGISDSDDVDLPAQLYTLADSSTRVENYAAVAATGTSTSIGDSLLSIIDGARSQSLAAVILGSDGNDTVGGLTSDQLDELAGFGVPIHTIAVGRDSIPDDLELTQVLLPEKTLPGSTVSARVSIRHDRAGEARVKIYEGDELLATEPVQLAPNVTTTTAWVDVELRDAGYHRLQFTLEGDTDEPELRNNQRSSLIKVEEQQYRVLYFEGEPRWEYKFLRRALDPEEDISLISMLRVSPNKFYRQGLESAEQLEDGFPATKDELFAYDALIIGSIEAASFSEAQLGIIREFVSERGGSLLMLAGPSGLGNGGWGQSSIADLLPARLPPSSSDSFVREKAPVVLTPQGAGAQMLKLAESDDENRQAWDSLPEIADYQGLGDLKPATMRLLNVATESGNEPLLVTQPYGRGNAYILATGGTWRWQMSMPLEDQSHEVFWQQLIRALVSSAPPGIALFADSVGGETAVRLRGEFRDEAFSPMNDIQVSAVVSHEDGESWTVNLVPSADEAGVYEAQTNLDKSGTWYFEAIAERDGEPVHTARTSLYSESGQAEFFNIRRNSAMLQRLSDATGGRTFTPDDLSALPDLLRYSNAGITEQIIRPVWDALAMFMLLLILKSGEWLFRRRWSSI